MLNIIRNGDMSTAVHKLQTALQQDCYNITPDGRFGDATERVLREYQRRQGLAPDGIAGPMTIQALKLNLRPTGLTNADFDYAARRLNCEEAVIKAVAQVESPGSGFNAQGLPRILYERHYFHRLVIVPRKPGETVEILTAKRQRLMTPANRDICWPSGSTGRKDAPAIDRYGPESHQYGKLARARAISDTAGLMSASWGKFQVMGENGVAFGWPTVQSFHRAMQASERDHLDSFIAYILGRSGRINGVVVRMQDALRAKNFRHIAHLYNGPGNVDAYAPKMQAAYNALR